MLRIVTRSVRHKLALVMLTTTFTALAVTGVAMAVYYVRAFQESGVNDLVTQAEILGRAGAPALAFDDPKSAREYLSLLKAKPKISAAAIYNAKGRLFAMYTRSDAADLGFPRLPELDASRIEGNELVLFKRIVENNEILGTVYLKADYELFEQLKGYIGILGAVMALSLLVALLMSAWLQAAVTKPILAVTGVARQVMERRDFSLRVRKTTEDEIGYLVDAFNDMLAEVGRRAEALETSNRTLEHEMAERRHAEDELRNLNVELERRVAERTAQLQAVTDTANDAIVSADRDGNIVYFNQAASRIFGYAVDEAIGQPLTLLMPASFHASHKAGLQRFLSGQPATVVGKTVELAGRRKNTTEFPLELSLAAWRTGAGVFFTGIIRDITDRKHFEQSLQQANHELESFSYSVSHDLRSPLRAIDGFSRILQEDYAGNLDGEGLRLLGIVRDNSQRMGQLIDDLLEFSRLGRKSLSTDTIDMMRLVEEVLGELQMPDGKPPELMIGALPPARGDATLLKQVWANLLANAIKFSSKREQPVVEVSGHESGVESVYCVKDNGAGFDMRYYDKLFGVFQRLHSMDEFAGTGVGLAIVQRVVARHGGRVWAEGKMDQGAAFYFSLSRGKQDG